MKVSKKEELRLVFPTPELREEALAYRQEYFDCGVFEINGDGGLDEAESYEGWLEKVRTDLTRDDGTFVPSTTYFALVGDRIVGTIQIRNKLNDFLHSFGGHIGYGVRPSERRKGYAAKMLALALEQCRGLGLKRALVTCNRENTGSAKTILKNCGVLENEVVCDDGEIRQRYWIDL